MLGLKQQTWVSIFGAVSLIIIVMVQVLPHTATLFDVEIAQTLECEESDADEKDIEEEQVKDKKFWNEADAAMLLTQMNSDKFLSFQASSLSGPYLDQHLPPPDFV